MAETVIRVLWSCDQCATEEWRGPLDEPWLCVVCGYMRWRPIAEQRAETGQPAQPDRSTAAQDPTDEESR